MGLSNKTTTELVSDDDTLGFIDYKLANSDHNPTHLHNGSGRTVLSSQGNGFLKEGGHCR